MIFKPRFCTLAVWLALTVSVQSTVFSNSSVPGLPWPATDALGRNVVLPQEAGALRPERFVGIFYFLWHNQRDGKAAYGEGPHDVSKILTMDPEALTKPDSPLWGPIGMYHYWGEPLYGYYLSTDPWVLRRHAYLLSDAGIDVLIFDTTNAVTYPEVYQALCEVFTQVRREGGNTPQIAFMVNTEAGKTAERIYEDLYKPGRYRELWFEWQGKPLMICDPKQDSPELQSFFTLRRAHWPFEMVNTPYAWHWEATYPQPYGYTEEASEPEQVNVSIAQNLRQSDGKVTNMSEGNARGRSFHQGHVETAPDAVNHGYNMEEQWQRVFELQPPFVMVTGWNEWIAGRWGKPGGPIVFVDQFSQEYSRDIEPMKGGHGDNYYWQMVSNVRRYKGAPALPESSEPKTIEFTDDFDSWKEIVPEYKDHIGETIPRDYDGSAGLHYTNRTGRNDIELLKVCRDENNIYFYARTHDPMTTPSDDNWMWLLIDIDRNPQTGWQGYDCILNHTLGENGKTWLEKNEGGWKWTKAVEVRMQVKGNELQMSIPRTALGLDAGTAVSFDFKWADNVQNSGDILDFYLSGDCAPEGRFKYRYDGD